jgi:hypothetical protein
MSAKEEIISIQTKNGIRGYRKVTTNEELEADIQVLEQEMEMLGYSREQHTIRK